MHSVQGHCGRCVDDEDRMKRRRVAECQAAEAGRNKAFALSQFQVLKTQLMQQPEENAAWEDIIAQVVDLINDYDLETTDLM